MASTSVTSGATSVLSTGISSLESLETGEEPAAARSLEIAFWTLVRVFRVDTSAATLPSKASLARSKRFCKCSAGAPGAKCNFPSRAM